MGDQNYQIQYERDLIINNRVLKYKGIFLVDDLVSTINRALEFKCYEKKEKKTEEVVTEYGRKTEIELRPFKEKTDYARYMIKLRITLDKVTESIEKVNGGNKKFQKGEILINFDSWLLTDYHGRWQMKPGLYFIKALFNKFIYKLPLETSFKGEVAEDTAYIYAQIKKLLNSYKHESGTFIKEKDVMKEIAEDIGSMKN